MDGENPYPVLAEALSHADEGRDELAIVALEEVLTRQQEAVTPLRLGAMAHLGLAYRDVGRADDAVRLWSSARHLALEHRDDEAHAWRMIMLYDAAQVASRQGRRSEAESLLEALLDDYRSRGRFLHAETLARAVLLVGRLKTRTGRGDEVLVAYDAALAWARRSSDVTVQTTGWLLREKSRTHADRGELRAALQTNDELIALTSGASSESLGPLAVEAACRRARLLQQLADATRGPLAAVYRARMRRALLRVVFDHDYGESEEIDRSVAWAREALGLEVNP